MNWRRAVMRWVLLALASVCIGLAAPHSKTWENLGQLHAGDRVEIVTSGASANGEFVSSSTESLTIRTGHGEQRFSRPDVIRVVSRASSHRTRNALIGAGIGVAISIIADQTIGTYLRNESNPDIARPLIWTVPIAAGGAIGALIPGYPVIYRK